MTKRNSRKRLARWSTDTNVDPKQVARADKALLDFLREPASLVGCTLSNNEHNRPKTRE